MRSDFSLNTIRKENNVLSKQRRNHNDGRKYSKKSVISKEAKNKENIFSLKIKHRQLLANCAWLPGGMHIEERLNEEPRIEIKQRGDNETK